LYSPYSFQNHYLPDICYEIVLVLSNKMALFNVKTILLCLIIIFLLGFLIPEGKRQIPVAGASSKDWNPQSFWYYPWGLSGVHKGIDIFAKEGTPVIAAAKSMVIYSGSIATGGNVVLMLGVKWRFYYYAHLKDISANAGQWRNAGEKIGTVGTSGNAAGKPPHLHFSIRTLFPALNQYDSRQKESWRKMFYIDPQVFLAGTNPS
jgi:peptidoglycan LD-endopeptidase LytH